MLDAEFNALTDDVNRLAHGINAVQAGNIPGADDPLNTNKVLKTDGQGTLSFTLINSNQLAAGAVVEAALGAQSVTTPKIGDGAVTNSKLADSSVQTRHLHASAVETDKIVDRSVTTAKLGLAAVQTANIAPSAVTAEKIAVNAVTEGQIRDSAVITAKIANAAVTTQKIGLGAVTTNEITNLAVTNPKVALKAIQATNIDAQSAASSTVLMAQGAGNVSFNKIAASSFDASLIQSGSMLGSLNGITLAPVGGCLFCMFQILSGMGSTLKWHGFNVREATCVPDRDYTECIITVTYKRRVPSTGGLLGFAAHNVHGPSYSDTGFTYQAPDTASFLVLAYLPDGN
jgi:hypothetical protein